MMTSGRISTFKQLILTMCAVPVLLIVSISAAAQVHPPRPLGIFVDPSQPLSFGAFFQGPMGGTVIISPAGFRSVTGDVGQLGLGVPFTPALIEVEALPGTLVSILNGPDVTLSGSNGGSMSLHIGASSPASPFVVSTTPPSRTLVTVGGTLTIGSPASNPPGTYSGTFNVIFIEQ